MVGVVSVPPWFASAISAGIGLMPKSMPFRLMNASAGRTRAATKPSGPVPTVPWMSEGTGSLLEPLRGPQVEVPGSAVTSAPPIHGSRLNRILQPEEAPGQAVGGEPHPIAAAIRIGARARRGIRRWR